MADLYNWNARTPPGSALDAPPLVWTGAEQVISAARINAVTSQLMVANEQFNWSLTERHPLNRSWYDDASTRFFAKRSIHLRGTWKGNQFVARTLWPSDFCLPQNPTSRPLPATAAALRERIREQPLGGAKSDFSVELLWKRTGSPSLREESPAIGFILNGSQGDDDEAHGGHFATAIGHVGKSGAINDWLVANYYTLDSESEKGIIAASVPLDNYFADLNAGQSWYRPSYMLIAVLRNQRTASHIQSALSRVFNQFYRHQFTYQHARANCSGISVSTLRALGWAIPAVGAESWLKAVFSIPLVSIANASLSKGKATFDYLTEDQTRLYPAVAFEQIGSDLLQLAQGLSQRNLSEFEAMLAEDIESLLFVRIPQFPSSRAWGYYPVANSLEYRERFPKKPKDRQIVPVGPRPFPKNFIDPDAPSEPPLRSDYAVGGYALLLILLALLLLTP